tara:strand:+ start:2317 stop:2937 length:621 start_codon:yes stop_codon:yes gene_type:complete
VNNIKIKICGVKDLKIAKHCIRSNVDFLGFILNVKESPRNIDFNLANEILKLVNKKIETVAVTKNPSEETVLSIKELPFSYIQVHGNLAPDEIERIKKISNKKIIKAFNLKDEIDTQYIEKYSKFSDYYLFDSISSGSGKSFKWSLLKNIRLSRDFFLSGGLNIENIKEAISLVNTNYFDLSSGVEDKNHVKNEVKITDLLNKIKN